VNERDEALWQAWERMEMHRFWWGNLKENPHYKHVGVDEGIC
jgi:hypothetical protein